MQTEHAHKLFTASGGFSHAAFSMDGGRIRFTSAGGTGERDGGHGEILCVHFVHCRKMKREWARRAHEHGGIARFRYSAKTYRKFFGSRKRTDYRTG
jgi:hypothetical protein